MSSDKKLDLENLISNATGASANDKRGVVGRLLTPEEIDIVAGATDGGNYNQINAGDYTQNTGGSHNQASGHYTQSMPGPARGMGQ